MEFELTTLALLLGAAFVAGVIDAIAGGGGLITVPALLATGMPPAMALATNKLQASFGSLTATLYFLRKGLIDLRAMRLAIVCTFAGSVLGTALVQHLDSALLRALLPFLLMLFALYFLLSPRLGDDDTRRRLGAPAFALLIGTGVGFYDGFFGPGTGSLFALAFVALAGYGIRKATAHTKLLNFVSNFASLLAFIIGGQVVWLAGLAMAAGQLLGAALGARLVVSRGAALIKPLLVTVSLAVSARLLWQQ